LRWAQAAAGPGRQMKLAADLLLAAGLAHQEVTIDLILPGRRLAAESLKGPAGLMERM